MCPHTPLASRRSPKIVRRVVRPSSGAVIATLFYFIFYTLSSAQLPPLTEDRFVHFGDVIEIDVAGGIEFDWRGGLSAEGFLEGLNSYGDPIYGRCRSEKDIAGDVAKAYSKFLRSPDVQVRIIDRSNRPVALLDGAVKIPHRFQLNRPARLRELVVFSGGVTDDASGEIQIFRPANLNCLHALTSDGKSGPGNKEQTIDISIQELLSGKETANPTILSGDLITIKRADVVYVIGGVKNPKQIAARTQTTLTRAIAIAGGVAKGGSASSVMLYRRENGENRSLEFDLARIVSGEVVDPPLLAFDIVEVPLKKAEKRPYPPIISRNALGVKTKLPLRVVD